MSTTRNFFDRTPSGPPADMLADEGAAEPPQHPGERHWQPASLYRWFERFGISENTVNQFGCYCVQYAFPRINGTPAGEYPAICIPHLGAERRELNRRLRPPSGKPEMFDDPALPAAFNVLSIETPDIVWVAENEVQAMALVEAGFRQVIALFDGPGNGKTRFPGLRTHAELLTTIKRFVLCSSRTPHGLAWQEDLAARLGRHRCLTVAWPGDALRASDVLTSPGGAEAVQEALTGATPYPIDGLQRFDGATLDELSRRPSPTVSTTGCYATDQILHFPTEGRLIVITGIPNAGKSPWLRWVMVHHMRVHHRRFAVFTPEMSPWPEFVASCAEVYLRKQFWRRGGFHPDSFMSDDERRLAGNWLGERMTMLVSDSLDDPPALTWLLERAALAVLRDGTTDVVIDPWNEVDHSQGEMTEAQYINRALQQCKAFAARHGVNVWIVVHPRTQIPSRNGGGAHVPGGYDINGGAAWPNKADLGITVHRPEEVTEIHIWKSKHLRWGRKNSCAKLQYDINTGAYRDPDSDLLSKPEA